ncbi:GTP cyclohydrolase I FolE [Hugenholtzia roseola]|uniref:GTP cyclohydrolase I FolE n=1 Tax=Hugenholtzia roseola TaxID=1002 RepID=UPI000411E569|nr:GTP cyclohydrolase I FolE [Hugenholtzia roseola]
MKLNETLLNTLPNGNGNHNHDKQTPIDIDTLGDLHIGTSLETPMHAKAFELSDEEKIAKIEAHFREIMHTLGLDLTDDSLSGTPHRVAKMYVKEIFQGLNPKNKPDVKLFENKYAYERMLVEKDITFFSNCEHHFVPIYGKVHVAYIPNGKVVGLSKINRLVDYYARRPQVQERLTNQIAQELRQSLETEDVAVIVDAYHMCVSSRGVQDVNSSTVTAAYFGKFKEESLRSEFLKYIELSK